MPESPNGAPAAAEPRSQAQTLLRHIGKPASEWTADDLLAFVRDQEIRVLSLMHVGGDGWLKSLDFVPRDSAHLADVLTGGERADGSSLFGDLGIPVGASDIVMRPRLSTAFIDPFAAEPTLAVLCSHYNRQGAPLAESPDTLVRAAYQRLVAETGVELHALGEIEFFLGARLGDAEAYGLDEPDEIQTPMAAVPMTEDNTVNGNNDDPALNANRDEPLDLKGLDDIENQLSDAAAEFQGLIGDKSVETTIPEHPEEKVILKIKFSHTLNMHLC